MEVCFCRWKKCHILKCRQHKNRCQTKLIECTWGRHLHLELYMISLIYNKCFTDEVMINTWMSSAWLSLNGCLGLAGGGFSFYRKTDSCCLDEQSCSRVGTKHMTIHFIKIFSSGSFLLSISKSLETKKELILCEVLIRHVSYVDCVWMEAVGCTIVTPGGGAWIGHMDVQLITCTENSSHGGMGNIPWAHVSFLCFCY